MRNKDTLLEITPDRSNAGNKKRVCERMRVPLSIGHFLCEIGMMQLFENIFKPCYNLQQIATKLRDAWSGS